MTVKDLIRYLEKLPKDTVIGVVYRCYSDLQVLDEDDITFYDKSRIDDVLYRREHRQWVGCHEHDEATKRYVLRNGHIMEYDERTWPKEETPYFVPILVLPGN